jgi:hypothetical protein
MILKEGMEYLWIICYRNWLKKNDKLNNLPNWERYSDLIKYFAFVEILEKRCIYVEHNRYICCCLADNRLIWQKKKAGNIW